MKISVIQSVKYCVHVVKYIDIITNNKKVN